MVIGLGGSMHMEEAIHFFGIQVPCAIYSYGWDYYEHILNIGRKNNLLIKLLKGSS